MQRRKVLFPDPDGPDDAEDLPRRDLEVDAAEHLEAAIGLMDSLGTNHRCSDHGVTLGAEDRREASRGRRLPVEHRENETASGGIAAAASAEALRADPRAK